MTIDKISNGIAEYIHHEVIPHIPDAKVKTMLGAVVFALRRNPEMTATLMNNPIIASVVKCNDGEYDLSIALDAIAESVREYGNLEVTIPRIPFLMAEEKTMSFSASDIERLRSYME